MSTKKFLQPESGIKGWLPYALSDYKYTSFDYVKVEHNPVSVICGLNIFKAEQLWETQPKRGLHTIILSSYTSVTLEVREAVEVRTQDTLIGPV